LSGKFRSALLGATRDPPLTWLFKYIWAIGSWDKKRDVNKLKKAAIKQRLESRYREEPKEVEEEEPPPVKEPACFLVVEPFIPPSLLPPLSTTNRRHHHPPPRPPTATTTTAIIQHTLSRLIPPLTTQQMSSHSLVPVSFHRFTASLLHCFIASNVRHPHPTTADSEGKAAAAGRGKDCDPRFPTGSPHRTERLRARSF
jgi:hypothetical protein